MSSPPRQARPSRTGARSPLAAGVLGFALLIPAGCGGGSDQPTAEDFERIVVESSVGANVGPDVATSYAECLYRETNGNVNVLIEHLDDAEYQPVGAEADAVAACSEQLIDAG